MKRLTNGVLTAITLVGTFLVSENVLTAGQLSDIQSILGLALAGGGLSIGMIIAIIRALPTQLVSAGYDKAVEKYGSSAVENVFNKFDEFMDLLNTVDTKLDNIQNGLDNDRELRTQILSE